VKLRLFETLLREGPGDYSLFSLGSARVGLSTSSENVKAELTVDALLGDSLSVSLARAFVAVRFTSAGASPSPRARLTVGKARLSWGEGLAFNAADLLGGSSPAAAIDLTSDILRDDASWMAALYVPLGRFSFAEALVVPPALDVAQFAANPSGPLPDPGDASLGGRLVGKLAGIKAEADYLFEGKEGTHGFAVSFQGNLLVDWHLSAAASLGASAPLAGGVLESLRLSAGLFHLQRLGPRATLGLRLEALVAPAGEWAEVEPPGLPAPVYGLLLYPELALAVDSRLSVTARALVSPVEASAVIVPGVSVSLHEGLSLFAMASVALGDGTDSWAWDRRGGLSLLAGSAFTY
jgi:hypothetical protein